MSKKLDFETNELDSPIGKARYHNIRSRNLGYDPDSLPYSIRVLLENTLRFSHVTPGTADAVDALTKWPSSIGEDIPFMPARVLLQDYTGVPLIVDLAAMRTAGIHKGLNPSVVNSKVPVDLVIDHSIQVDAWGNQFSILQNLDKEYERNSERYSLLKWAQSSFDQTRVFPPGKGICHQFNLEYLGKVVSLQKLDKLTAFPDTLVGTDSHTTMINGLGVLGWGVGGIEAEAVMLGEPYFLAVPKVIGVKFTGQLQEGATPTDLVLTVTEALRHEDLVGVFVEYFGESYSKLSVPDRATIGNMSPEYGATVGFCPVDHATITYLLGTGRDQAYVDFVKKYCIAQGLFVSPDTVAPKYSKVIEIDLDKVEPSIAGPRNPDELIPLKSARNTITGIIDKYGKPSPDIRPTKHEDNDLQNGSVIIAAITSCTNTSNPTVMIGAGLLASKAAKLGLTAKSYVKRSMAPGSNVVRDYLAKVDLLSELERLGFDIVGYGCTTCIGNSGPLTPEVEKQILENDLYVVAVLSGNRNFDGRIHPLAKGAFLMSPMLVVAYALAGRIDFDFYNEPLGTAKDGSKVYLKDIWPTLNEIQETATKALSPNLFKERYADAQTGDKKWGELKAPAGQAYEWDNKSTYILEPPWFNDKRPETGNISNGRVLAIFWDKVTTDHISPAGTIPIDSPAGHYLKDHGVPFGAFSTYGSRRGNHEIMVRGGFSNIRLKNSLANGKEGGWTTHYPSKELLTIYDAAIRYQSEGIPLIILAGKQYGTGSSRDWAAKATMMLGVRAVIAESFERIHRSNLIAMGVLPLEFSNGQNWQSLNLKGTEIYEIAGIEQISKPKPRLTVHVKDTDKIQTFEAVARLDNEIEIAYYRAGGILRYVFDKISDS